MSANEPAAKILDLSFQKAVQVSKPEGCLPSFIPEPPLGKTYVIGAGKGAAEMARVFEENYRGAIEEGVVVTRYGFDVPTREIEVLQAAHPVPDAACGVAVDRMIEVLGKAQKDDLVVCLLCGGGSSLLSAPVAGVSLAQVQDITKQLLHSGADIAQMNTVRKHLNRALGGGLAKAAGEAKLLTLAISDVAYNDPSVIASGPTIGDPTTLEDCLGLLDEFDIQADDNVLQAFKNPENETPKPNDSIFENTSYQLIATPDLALQEAKKYLEEQGCDVDILDAHLGGDTNEQALAHVRILFDKVNKIAKPYVLLSGGETTVKVLGDGLGGPNTQFMLQAAIALNANPKIVALSCDTDGIDGAGDNAGALITPETLGRAEKLGLAPQDFLDNNDSYNFFKALNDLIISGPTQTNVNDYRAFLIMP